MNFDIKQKRCFFIRIKSYLYMARQVIRLFKSCATVSLLILIYFQLSYTVPPSTPVMGGSVTPWPPKKIITTSPNLFIRLVFLSCIYSFFNMTCENPVLWLDFTSCLQQVPIVSTKQYRIKNNVLFSTRTGKRVNITSTPFESFKINWHFKQAPRRLVLFLFAVLMLRSVVEPEPEPQEPELFALWNRNRNLSKSWNRNRN